MKRTLPFELITQGGEWSLGAWKPRSTDQYMQGRLWYPRERNEEPFPAAQLFVRDGKVHGAVDPFLFGGLDKGRVFSLHVAEHGLAQGIETMKLILDIALIEMVYPRGSLWGHHRTGGPYRVDKVAKVKATTDLLGGDVWAYTIVYEREFGGTWVAFGRTQIDEFAKSFKPWSP